MAQTTRSEWTWYVGPVHLASRYDLLVLELISYSPSLFSYAERQLLKSHDPDVIERLVERKLRRLRWNVIVAFGFTAMLTAQCVFIARETGLSDVSLGQGIGIAMLTFWTVKVRRDRVGLRECAGRLVEHIKMERDRARRAG